MTGYPEIIQHGIVPECNYANVYYICIICYIFLCIYIHTNVLMVYFQVAQRKANFDTQKRYFLLHAAEQLSELLIVTHMIPYVHSCGKPEK